MNTLPLPGGDHELGCSSVIDFFLSTSTAVGKLLGSCLPREAMRPFFSVADKALWP